jgi:CRISPR-associated protein Csb1
VYDDESVLGPIKDDKDRKERSTSGFTHVPATASHGGVIAKGGIRRDATLALTALNLISAGSDKDATLKLRRYILGLALVAFTRLPAGYLRQGTILVSDPDKPRKTDEVYPTGERKACTVTHEAALEYAKEAAKAFGVGANREEPFDTELAKKDLQGKEDKAAAKAKKTK